MTANSPRGVEANFYKLPMPGEHGQQARSKSGGAGGKVRKVLAVWTSIQMPRSVRRDEKYTQKIEGQGGQCLLQSMQGAIIRSRSPCDFAGGSALSPPCT